MLLTGGKLACSLVGRECAEFARCLVEADAVANSVIHGTETLAVCLIRGGEEGFLDGKRYVIMDRDGKFCPAFQEILKNEGSEPPHFFAHD